MWGRTDSRIVSEENKNTPKAGYVLEAPWWQLRLACTLSCLFSGFTTDWLEGGGWVFIWKKLQYKLLPFQKNHRCKFLWQNTHESVLPTRYRTVMIHWAFIWFLKADILLKDEIIYCCSEAHEEKEPQMPTFGVGGAAICLHAHEITECQGKRYLRTDHCHSCGSVIQIKGLGFKESHSVISRHATITCWFHFHMAATGYINMPSVPTYDLYGIMHIVSSNKLKTSSGDIINTHRMHLLWKQEKVDK